MPKTPATSKLEIKKDISKFLNSDRFDLVVLIVTFLISLKIYKV